MKTEMINLVKDDRRRAKRRVEFIRKHEEEIDRVTRGFSKVPGYVSLRMDWSCCLDLSYSGDIKVLQAAFHAFRTLGYAPTCRPENKEDPTFATHFTNPEHPEIRWWFYYTSTTCKRVKTGTKMQEVDIYETQCIQDVEVDVELLPGYDGESDLAVIEHENT